jgi:hypothetical protein
MKPVAAFAFREADLNIIESDLALRTPPPKMLLSFSNHVSAWSTLE